MVLFIVLRFNLVIWRLIGAQMVEMNFVDVNSCWVRIYEQSNPITWEQTTISTCTLKDCKYSPSSTDYLNFDDLSLYEDRGYGFYMVWDDIYYMTWKQKTNPLEVLIDSTEKLLTGDYYYYGLSPNIFQYRSILDFGGLGLSSDVGVLVDGRSKFGPWFAIGVSKNVKHTGGNSIGIQGWRNRAGYYYLANKTKLYVWDTGCGSWKIPSFSPTFKPTAVPTINPTTKPSKFPTQNPTTSPTKTPTEPPTTTVPSPVPSPFPSSKPTIKSTATPTTHAAPALEPTTWNTMEPSFEPSPNPSISNSGLVIMASNNDHKLLYMIVGFSVTGFLVLAAAVLLCSKRVEMKRSEDVKQTILELYKMGTISNSTLRDSAMFQESVDRNAFNMRRSNLSLSPISNPGLVKDQSFSQNLEPGSVDHFVVNALREKQIPRNPSYELKSADEAPFVQRRRFHRRRSTPSSKTTKAAELRREDVIYIPRIRSKSTGENKEKTDAFFVPASEENIRPVEDLDNEYILAELSNWRRELSQTISTYKSADDCTSSNIEMSSSSLSYSLSQNNQGMQI